MLLRHLDPRKKSCRQVKFAGKGENGSTLFLRERSDGLPNRHLYSQGWKDPVASHIAIGNPQKTGRRRMFQFEGMQWAPDGEPFYLQPDLSFFHLRSRLSRDRAGTLEEDFQVRWRRAASRPTKGSDSTRQKQRNGA